MIIEKKIFTAGVDSDTDMKLMANDAMLNCMNGRLGISKVGRNLRIENFLGTSVITQSVYPPYGTQQCIGSAVDLARGWIIYALYNTHGDHGIYARDVSGGITYAVLYDSQVIGGLGFDKNNRIDKNFRVMGDLVYWTDNNNMPRRMNFIAGIKMNHPSFITDVSPYSWPMTQSVIAWIRRPFGLGITATKLTDGTVSENYLNKFAGQFASRLKYRDGEYTVTSLPSNMLNLNYSTDTYNAADVVFDINEDFDQDVQEVQLLVRYNNDPSYFIIKTWNRDVGSENLQLYNHNNGIAALTYRFYNDRIGVSVGDYESIKPEDPVPIRTKTIESALNRMFMSNYVRGYDTPPNTSLYIDTLTISNTDSANAACFKAFSSYQIGVRFRDLYGRKSFVVTNDGCIFSIPDKNFGISSYITQISWGLSNTLATTEIPDWAYYYDILITKNLRTRYFLTGSDLVTQYAFKQADGTFTYQTTYAGNAYGIALDAAFILSGYTFSEGDLCRLYIQGGGTVYELPVLGQDGDKILIGLLNIGDLATQPALEFELYTPYKKSNTEAYYTTGNTYLVSNPGTGSRTYSTLTGSIAGDIYRQKISYTGPITRTVRYESMSPDSNIDPLAWFNIFGQSNIQSELGQKEKTNYMMFSEVGNIGTEKNGLSSFDALNEKRLPDGIGQISKLQLANKIEEQGTVMLAIGELETASIYLGEVQVVGASKNAFLAKDEGVIGTINILQGSYGTTMPSSVVEYLGLVFWFDLINGCYVQYSSAGLEPVSRYNMMRFFKSYASDFLANNSNNLDNINGFHHIPGFVDPFHLEIGPALPALIYSNYADTLPSYSSVPSYATSIIDRFDVYDKLAKRMSFTFEKNYWGGGYEGIGEHYEYVLGRMFSWKDGAMYEHHTNDVNWNTVYGVTYPVRICTVANKNPSLLKVVNNVCIEGSAKPNFSVAMTVRPNVQITDLASSDDAWADQEGNFYATWLMDRLSPNASGNADQKIYTGDPLTDIVPMFMFEWQQYSELFFVNFVDLGYSASRGQKAIANP